MSAEFIRTILSPFHGVISTVLDVFTGIDPSPRDLINQNNAAAQVTREEQAKRMRLHQYEKVREEQMYRIRRQKSDHNTQSRSQKWNFWRRG